MLSITALLLFENFVDISELLFESQVTKKLIGKINFKFISFILSFELALH